MAIKIGSACVHPRVEDEKEGYITTAREKLSKVWSTLLVRPQMEERSGLGRPTSTFTRSFCRYLVVRKSFVLCSSLFCLCLPPRNSRCPPPV